MTTEKLDAGPRQWPGGAVNSESLGSAFPGLHLHDGWTAEIKCRDLPDTPSVQLEKDPE